MMVTYPASLYPENKKSQTDSPSGKEKQAGKRAGRDLQGQEKYVIISRYIFLYHGYRHSPPGGEACFRHGKRFIRAFVRIINFKRRERT
jgi:hypothetical protein